MASLFWVGGSTAYDGVTNRLATSTGGSATVAVITSADTVTFDGSSPAGAVVTTSAAISCANLTLAAGFTGSLTMSNALTVATTLTHTQGTLNTNGQTCSWGTFNGNNGNVRTLTLGASNITITSGTNTVWDFTTTTGLTFNANSSTITFSGAAAGSNMIQGGGQTFNNIVITGSGAPQMGGSFTMANLTRTGTVAKTDGLQFNSGGTYTVTGTLTLTGNSATSRLLVSSGLIGTQHTVSLSTTGTVVASNTDFMDMTFTGTNIPVTGTSMGDAQGNSNITFDVAAPQTWSGNTTGSWSNSLNWTSRVPLPQDNVAVNALTSGTVTIDMPRIGANIDFTSSSGGIVSSSVSYTFYGNLTYVAAVTFSTAGAVAVVAAGRGSQTITSNTKTMPLSTGNITFAAPGGTYTLTDAFAVTSPSGIIQLNQGTLTANGNVSCGFFRLNQTANTKVLNMGSGTWTLFGAGTVWPAAAGGTTVNAQTSTIAITDTSTTLKSFVGAAGALIYNNMTITGAVAGGVISLSGASSFNSLTIGAGATVTLPSATTTTINSLTASGSSITNPGYLKLPGLAGQSATTPSASQFNFTTTMTIDAKLAPDNWTAIQAVVGKWSNANGGNSYLLRVNTIGITLTLSADGNTTSQSSTSTAATGFTNGTAHWIRATYTGNSATGLRFWTSADGSAWSQLGSSISTVATASIFSSSQQVELGVFQNNLTSPFSGNFYNVRLYSTDLGNGAGTAVFNADFSGVSAGATSFTESSANAATVSLVGAATQAWGRAALLASTTASAATLKSTNIIGTDYISVQDSTASGCIPFYAGANGALASGDTNWSAIANPNPTNLGSTLSLVGVG